MNQPFGNRTSRIGCIWIFRGPPFPVLAGIWDDANVYDDEVTRAVRRWRRHRPLPRDTRLAAFLVEFHGVADKGSGSGVCVASAVTRLGSNITGFSGRSCPRDATATSLP